MCGSQTAGEGRAPRPRRPQEHTGTVCRCRGVCARARGISHTRRPRAGGTWPSCARGRPMRQAQGPPPRDAGFGIRGQAGGGSPECHPAACSRTSTCRPRHHAARLRARGRRRQRPRPLRLRAREHAKDSEQLTHRTHHGAGAGAGARLAETCTRQQGTPGPIFLAQTRWLLGFNLIT